MMGGAQAAGNPSEDRISEEKADDSPCKSLGDFLLHLTMYVQEWAHRNAGGHLLSAPRDPRISSTASYQWLWLRP